MHRALPCPASSAFFCLLQGIHNFRWSDQYLKLWLWASI